jgi:hypothetical protein
MGVSTSRKSCAHHEVADGTDGLAARLEAVARGLVHHQVNVALAVFHLLVGHAVELVGHGAQALGQQAHAAGVQRQLARAGLEHLAFAGHDVAQVPVLERGIDLFAHVVARHVNLETAGGVLQRGKAGLAHHALEHHAPGYAGGGAFYLQHFRRFSP